MFEQQQFVIKSGEGKNYFEATVLAGEDASPSQMREIMDGLRKLQKDRMEWAASGKVSA